MSDAVCNYGVFQSHSAKNEALRRRITERLRQAGLKYSHVPVGCVLADAFGPDWAQLKAGTRGTRCSPIPRTTASGEPPQEPRS